MSKKLIALLLVVVMVATLTVGCGDNNEPQQTDSSSVSESEEPEQKEEEQQEEKEEPKEETPKREIGGTLVAGIFEMSGNFNPLYYSSAYDAVVVDMVFQSLIQRNFEGEYEGVVAKDWEFSEDGKSITFHMRDDIVFSDGEPLTAEDVEFTYLVMADPSYTGRYSSAVKDMVGYDEYMKGETDVFKGVEVIDDYTIKFNFKEALRVNLSNCTYAIMPKHYYGKDFKPGDTSSVEAITTAPIGSGPYTLEKFEEKQFASLKRNPLYKDEGYYIENVICKFVDQTTDITELTSKGVDLLAGEIDPKKINQARATGFIKESSYPRSGYGYIKLNCEYGPTKDPKVRQALYYSFDIEEFVNSYFKDEETGEVLATVQYHPLSQISWAVDEELKKELIEYHFDLEKAKSILDEAGWKVGSSGYREKDGQILELNIAAMPDHDILNTLIPMWQRDWGEGLKVKLNIAYLEFNTMLDYVIYNSDENVDKWSLFFLATSINTPDPHSLYSSFHSDYIGSGEDNTCRYSNPKVDELLDKGKAIMDIEEAKPIYKEICKILNKEAPIMPVYANTYYDLYNEKIKNFKTSSLYDWVAALKDAYIEE